MTVIELVTQACERTGSARRGSVPTNLFTFCLNELNTEYEIIWNAYSWDEIKIFNLSVSSTIGIMTLPRYVDRIRATYLDSNTQPILPIDEARLNWIAADAVDKLSGISEGYSYLSPAPVLTQPSAAMKIRFSSSDSGDTTQKLLIKGTVADKDDSEEVSLNGTSNVDTTKLYTDIRQISKEQTTGRITIKQETDDTEIGHIPPSETQSEYRRIQLLPKPTDGTTATFHVFCLRRFETLISHYDQPLFAEPVLLEKVTAAMFRRNKQHDLAREHENKASLALQSAMFRQSEQEQRDNVSAPFYGDFGDLGEDYVHLTGTSKTGTSW